MTVEEVLYDKHFLTIVVHQEEKLIKLKWKGLATSEQFRDGFILSRKAILDHNLEFMLANLKMMEMIQPADEEWATVEFFPSLAKSSFRRLAIVTSLDFLNNSAIKRIVNRSSANTKFETRFFVDSPEALQWLQKLN
jgi:hypothetical protein